MALRNKQAVHVPLSGGQMEGTDEFLLSPPASARVENGIFDKEGVISKRFGDLQLANTGLQTNVDIPNSIHSLHEQLVLRETTGVASRSDVTSRWSFGAFSTSAPVDYTMEPLIRIADNLESVDITYSTGLIFYIWKEIDTFEVWYAAKDYATGATVVSPRELPGGEGSPRITKVADGTVFIFDLEGGELTMRTIDPQSPTVLSSPISIVAGVTEYEIYADGDVTDFVYACVVGGAGNRFFFKIDETGDIAASGSVGTNGLAPIFYNPSNDRLYSSEDTTLTWLPGDLTTYNTGGTIPIPSTWDPRGFLKSKDVFIAQLDDSNNISVFYNIRKDQTVRGDPPEFDSYGVAWCTADASAGSVSGGSAAYNFAVSIRPERVHVTDVLDKVFVGLVHKYFRSAFTVLGGADGFDSGTEAPISEYLCTLEENEGQLRCAATYNVDRAMVWRPLSGGSSSVEDGRNGQTANFVKTTSETDRTSVAFSVVEKAVGRDLLEDRFGINLLRYNLFPDPLLSTAADEGDLFSGGVVLGYDGEKVFENSIFYRPSLVHVEELAGGAGDPENWRFVIILKWVDARGKERRAVSNVYQTQVDPGLQDSRQRELYFFVPPNISPVGQAGVPFRYYVDVYSTENLGTWDAGSGEPDPGTGNPDALLFRVEANMIPESAGEANLRKVTIRPHSNYSFPAGPQLFTESGELPATQTPGTTFIETVRDRVWFVSSDDQSVAWHSKFLEPEFAPEFNENLVIQVPGDAGNLVGIAPLEDKIILLGGRRCYFLAGDGPDDAGNGQFYGPEPLRYGSGCVNPRSIVSFEGGVVFEAEEGLILIDPGLGSTRISDPIEDTLASLNIIRAIHASDRGGILFLGDDSESLWWDYEMNAWSVWNAFPATDACIRNGRITRVYDDNIIAEERKDFYDGLIDFSLNIKTPWVKLAQSLQGRARLWWIRLLGKYFTGDFQATVNFDYDDDVTQVELWTASEMNNPLKKRIKPVKQKCSAFQLELEETDTLTGKGFTVSGLTLELGVLPQSNHSDSDK